MTQHVVSVSGGKDSTATLLLALERGIEPFAIFADTGHEHPQTLDYVAYLNEEVWPIRTVRADFKARIAGKREYIVAKWAADGVPQARIDRALEVLVPTGNPFLDMCLWKGRFPSTRRRFCTEELKHHPIDKLIVPMVKDGPVLSWQGVRAQESRSRANLPRYEETDPVGLTIYRPILNWLHEDVFAQHRKHGVRWNPLYEQGMGRVGCMPCIHARKDELAEIAKRFPEEVERVKTWERLVSDAAKQGNSMFYDARIICTSRGEDPKTADIQYTTHGIEAATEWAMTARGGRQFDLVKAIDSPQCASIYGLCE